MLISLGKNNFCGALLVCALALGPFGVESRLGAQDSTEVAPKPSAARTIILPRKLVAGQPATLAVMDIDGRLTPGAIVELSGGIKVRTDSTGRAVFMAPGKPRVIFARLKGRPDRVSSVVVAPATAAETGFTVTSYSSVIGLGDRFEIIGSGFSGDGDENHANVGGKTALVIAASPVDLVVLPEPGFPVGGAAFSIESGGRSGGPFPIAFISLEVSATKKSLAAKERGVLSVRIKGSTNKLLVEARNLSPETVAVGAGNMERAVSSGGAENVARFELRGIRAGEFAISVHLVPMVMALPRQ